MDPKNEKMEAEAVEALLREVYKRCERNGFPLIASVSFATSPDAINDFTCQVVPEDSSHPSPIQHMLMRAVLEMNPFELEMSITASLVVGDLIGEIVNAVPTDKKKIN